MEDKVFQLDKECYLIYLNRFSENSNTFIRIGSTDLLLDFADRLNFVSLLSKLVTLNPEIEKKLLKKQKENKVIGLKESVEKYLEFVKESLPGAKLESVIVEEASELKDKKSSEKDFIEKIKNDYKLRDHSFASFYKDGNIRVFTQNSLLFELSEKLKEKKSFDYEFNQIKDSFASIYKESYNKEGFIVSNNTLFAFSNNNFLCIAFDNNWLKDAVRVGVELTDIKFLFLNYDFKPDIQTLKLFNDIENKDKSIDVVLFTDEDVKWSALFSKERVRIKKISDSLSENTMGKFKLLYKEKIINLKYNDFKFFLTADDLAPSKNRHIVGNYKSSNFKIALNSIEKSAYTLFEKNPLVITDEIARNDYIATFWDNFNPKQKENFLAAIQDNDYNYSDNFIEKIDKSNFYDQLFADSVRRVLIEGIKEVDDTRFEAYSSILRNFNGEVINNNELVLVQEFGYSKRIKNLAIRYSSIKRSSLLQLQEESNPMLIFENQESMEDWEKKLSNYRNIHKKNIREKEVDKNIISRFNNIIENKKFFKYEKERLERFLKDKEIEDKRKDNLAKREEDRVSSVTMTSDASFSNSSKTSKQYVTAKEEQALTEQDMDTVIEKRKERAKYRQKKKKIIALLSTFIILLILFIIAFSTLYYLRYIKIDKVDFVLKKYFNLDLTNKDKTNEQNSVMSQEDFLKKNNEKYHPNGASLKSNHYKFSMTVFDHIALVNEVANKNGYHKLAPDYLKPRLRGKDPDWIYPGNSFKMPDDTTVTVVYGDTLWGICEKYLVNEINNHEERIRALIEDTKRGTIDIIKAKEGFKKIREETHSQMMRDVIDTLLTLETFDAWEPYLDKTAR